VSACLSVRSYVGSLAASSGALKFRQRVCACVSAYAVTPLAVCPDCPRSAYAALAIFIAVIPSMALALRYNKWGRRSPAYMPVSSNVSSEAVYARIFSALLFCCSN